MYVSVCVYTHLAWVYTDTRFGQKERGQVIFIIEQTRPAATFSSGCCWPSYCCRLSSSSSFLKATVRRRRSSSLPWQRALKLILSLSFLISSSGAARLLLFSPSTTTIKRTKFVFYRTGQTAHCGHLEKKREKKTTETRIERQQESGVCRE